MPNAFSVFKDGSAMVKHCVALASVGAATLTATVVVLARVVSSLTVGAP
ncbi:hypothetical protein SAMN05444171_6687 [Bradyrhizobium lablabi]|uniref:Uncharacterized protein n=2 Tax=Bradyrhizobium TaxID=374 RepID=A0ABY0PBD2_9BRAD|nr:hypothetical protein SAMN05444163_0481 [Bradyrhizobium ottawaense]SEE21713.1 hypothetical protein SAMN05444171_6687 [Bradyrhizobium lablabi]SHM17927.1 hypothetical protein SAMN05444321_5487 [Bradyrhizobium lablabi]